MRSVLKVLPTNENQRPYVILGLKVMTITSAAMLLLASAVFYLSSKNVHQIAVSISESEFHSWPLVVPHGIVINSGLRGQTEIVFETPTHQFYGLNQTAIKHGYANIREITKKNPSKPGQYMDVSDLIRFASALVKEP